MKKNFSLLKVNWNNNDTKHLTFFAIPKSMENQFIEEPKLLHETLNAVALYSIESSKYKENIEYYNDEAYRQFDNYVDYMVRLSGNSE